MLSETNRKHKSVLVIEPRVDRANAICLELTMLGHAAQSALNFEHALSLLKSVEFDCVMMEIHPENNNGSISILLFIQSTNGLNHNLAVIGIGNHYNLHYSSIQKEYPNVVGIISPTVGIDELCQQVVKLPTRQILVVDDDYEFRLLLKLELERGGYSMFEAANVETAEKLLETRRFMCLITDIVFGVNKTSQPLIQYLDQTTCDDLNFGLPVLVTSSYINKNNSDTIMKKGVMVLGVIKKPFSKGEFVKSLNYIFNFYASGWIDELCIYSDINSDAKHPVGDKRLQAIHNLILDILKRGEDNYLHQIESYLKTLPTLHPVLEGINVVLENDSDDNQTEKVDSPSVADDNAARFRQKRVELFLIH